MEGFEDLQICDVLLVEARHAELVSLWIRHYDSRGARLTNVDEGVAELDQSAIFVRLAAIRWCDIDVDAILVLLLFENEDERECRRLSERVVLQLRCARSHRDPSVS
jgi:hypothetical protein